MTPSSSDEHWTEVDRAWAEEIDRRAKEIDEGKVTLVPWDDACVIACFSSRGAANECSPRREPWVNSARDA